MALHTITYSATTPLRRWTSGTNDPQPARSTRHSASSAGQPLFRHAVDLALLTSLVVREVERPSGEYAEVFEGNVEVKAGMKRAREASVDEPPKKKARQGLIDIETHGVQESSKTSSTADPESSFTEPLPFVRFSLEIDVASLAPGGSNEALSRAQKKAEDDFFEALGEHSGKAPPARRGALHLGAVELRPEDNKLCAFLKGERLLTLPRVPWSLDSSSEDLDATISSEHDDVLHACYTLSHFGFVSLSLSGRLMYDVELKQTFRVAIDLAVSLNPAIKYPTKANAATRAAHEETQRLLVRFLALVAYSAQGSASLHPDMLLRSDETEDATIPYFYSVLKPAERVCPPFYDTSVQTVFDALQPDGLIPDLLPFQKRSVAWMLSREGRRISTDGTIVPAGEAAAQATGAADEEDRLPVFWRRLDVSGSHLYVNLLTHAVRRSPPRVDDAFGGILAEEPGLGKTVECIALMLLNPAPLARNGRAWDKETQCEVTEIKTTLIVTPPALAPQWADELALHAPDLKVIIYNGWNKLKIPRSKMATASHADLEDNSTPQPNKPGESSKRRPKSKRPKSAARTPASDADADTTTTADTSAKAALLLDVPGYINQFDVCITTYPVLRQELAVARAPPKRPRRADVTYSNVTRPRSPLVVCEWYRVVMDEVQMMGGGKSEEMVSLIPRLSSFAVSGTPARSTVQDLIHVLRFLRVDGLIGAEKTWNRLTTGAHKAQFAELFQKYAIRTLKSTVTEELTIPQQHRYLVSIELGRVERHVYDHNLEEALIELGIDARGVAASAEWEVNAALLRTTLRKLRGICTHPLVGQLQQRQNRMFKSTLKSIGDVLEAMREHNWRNTLDDRKAKVQELTRYAELQKHEQVNDRYRRALASLLAAEKEAQALADDVKVAIQEHKVKGDALKREAQVLRQSRKANRAITSSAQNNHADADGLENENENGEKANGNEKGKGKERERDLSPEDDEDDDFDLDVLDGSSDPEERGLPRNVAGEEHRAKSTSLQARLREALMVLHRTKFLQGDVYHLLGAEYAAREDAAYADAEAIRKDLLKTTEENAVKSMTLLEPDVTERKVTEQVMAIELPFLTGGGIRSAHLVEECNEIIELPLNEQTRLLWTWRQRIHALITQKLSTNGEQSADGEEYNRTLDTQSEAEVYLQAYAALLADRRETILSERTLLATHDVREKHKRHTKAAAMAASSAEVSADPELEVPEDVEVQPQHEILHKKLMDERKELRDEAAGRAIKSIMVELATVAANIVNDKDPEKIIARDLSAKLRGMIAKQGGLMDKMDADLAQLRKVFNDRILYFRQLQEISDTVAEATWEGSLNETLQHSFTEQANLDRKINAGRARQRYLDHLAKNQEDGLDEDDKACILCRCDFNRGFITQCAHVFCEDCMKAWMARREGKACPVCRVPINVDQLQRFSLEGNNTVPQRPVIVNGEPVPISRRQIKYNMIDMDLFNRIQVIEMNGSYGSKIETLVRHLLYIQMQEPGAKSVIFSAWSDSLQIVEFALERNGIPCLRIDQAGKGRDTAAKRFRTNPELLVLLLHGERDNAGLNVTCASRVFLLESVVNHGFEVQAIARIDRMGQTKPTEVFCYYAEDTVERNILDLAARQGLSLYTEENSHGTLNVTPFAADGNEKKVDNPGKKKAQKGDFISKVDDMLAILFPHMYEDLEYLLPEGATGAPMDIDGDAGVTMGRQQVNGNAHAGPSRLR